MAGAVTKAKNKVLPVSGTSERTNTRGRQTSGASRKGGPVVERQYVGIDLHRRRSVIVRMEEDGEKLATVRVDNDPVALGWRWRRRARTRRWRWRPPRAGTGRSICCKRVGPRCTWCTPRAALGGSAGEERRAGRHRNRPWPSPQRPARGVDRPAAAAGAAGAGSLPGQAGGAALGAQGPGARRTGQQDVLPKLDDLFGPEGQRFLDCLLDPTDGSPWAWWRKVERHSRVREVARRG